jgi:hypothetical protein
VSATSAFRTGLWVGVAEVGGDLVSLSWRSDLTDAQDAFPYRVELGIALDWSDSNGFASAEESERLRLLIEALVAESGGRVVELGRRTARGVQMVSLHAADSSWAAEAEAALRARQDLPVAVYIEADPTWAVHAWWASVARSAHQDRSRYLALQAEGADPAAPRQLAWDLSFPSDPLAQMASRDLARRGYRTDVRPGAEGEFNVVVYSAAPLGTTLHIGAELRAVATYFSGRYGSGPTEVRR